MFRNMGRFLLNRDCVWDLVKQYAAKNLEKELHLKGKLFVCWITRANKLIVNDLGFKGNAVCIGEEVEFCIHSRASIIQELIFDSLSLAFTRANEGIVRCIVYVKSGRRKSLLIIFSNSKNT